MPLFINTNVPSLNAQRQLVSSGAELDRASERLSSGKRINKAADDAAGLAISNRLTSQIRGLNQAVRNANDGISLIQTAEGALAESTNILQRMRELAIQSANGIFDDAGRATLDAEVQQLIAELDRIAETTSFNGQALLDGQLGQVDLQIGAQANQTIGFEVQAVDSQTLGLGSQSADVIGGEIAANLTAIALNENDVLINGQAVGAFDSTNTLQDLLDNIDTNINGVTASSLVELNGSSVGTGVLSATQTVTIAVTDNVGNAQTFIIAGETESLQDLADKINADTNGIVRAAIDDNGQLSLAAQDAQQIALTDANSVTGIGDTTDRARIILNSDSGDPITIERGSTGTLADLQNLGFRESTSAGVITGVGLVQNSNGANESLQVGELSINGVAIDNDDTDSLVGKIAAINNVSEQTGVTANAFAQVTVDLTGVLFSEIDGTRDNININGLNIDLGGATITDSATLAAAFNDATDQTGVTARVLGTRLLLESDQGAINLGTASTAANTLVGTTTGIQDFTRVFIASGGAFTTSTTTLASGGTISLAVQAGLKLTSTTGNPISIELGDNTDAARLGLVEANTLGGASFGTSVASISVDSQANAQKAIDVIDNALGTINSIRSDLGAINNRLDFTISNLSNVSENSSAARSRILDADFAAETAALSRAQVLQQASSAILAQANARPQQVLSLLQ
ncbi:flagellin [Exilibacterium tricleocarpae]|uniref:Flagellin n=1 Tax=Exilibacterium tricleocarpae TaxID=2591008 RepID=A0A545U3U0_9GAMM|nr:flagellin [Exilibacterium tricleocarpae]TQV84142.1 flagellin [Exilibacterium tricleocarpae]